MSAALEKRYFELAGAEMLFSKWAEQTPKRAMELAQIIKTGEME